MKSFLLIGLFWVFTFPVFSQTDTAENKRYTLLSEIIKQGDSLRAADSLKKRDLMVQIENLKTSESKKRRELEDKLYEYSKSDSIKRAYNKKTINSLKSITKGVPVAPFNDTLFFVYMKIGAYTPKERARAIETKIRMLYDDPFYNPDSLKIIQGEKSLEIVYDEIILISITEDDALWMNKTKPELADMYLSKVRSEIGKTLEANSLKNLVYRFGFVLFILILLLILIKLTSIIFKYITDLFIKNKDKVFGGLKVSNYVLLNWVRVENAVLFFIKIIKLIFLLALVYFSSLILFSIFPETKGIADILVENLVSPVKKIFSSLIKFIPNLLSIIVIIIFTRYFIELVKFVAKEIESGALNIPGFHEDWVMTTYKIARFLILAFASIVIFPYLPGSDSRVFQGVTVLLGLLFSIGSSTAISNIIAGLVITYMRPFKMGDRIKVGDVTGDVIENNLLATRIRSIKNEDITIPNSQIMSNSSVNYSSSAKNLGLIIHTTVTIGYDAPWKIVHSLLIEAAKSTKGVLESPEPFVLQKSLDDFYVTYEINAYTEKSNLQAALYSELHQNIQNKFNSAGVEIMSPHYRSERDGNQSTIPGN
jgi:small-conductance mechanosensitive channel